MGNKIDVIVVDDSKTLRQQLRIALSDAGYNCIEAEDGKDGLDKIKANAAAKLVICDVNMPRMNGLEMLEAIKKDAVAAPPVLMLTTEGQRELIERAKAAGAKGWIIKPFKPDLLIAAVKKLAGTP